MSKVSIVDDKGKKIGEYDVADELLVLDRGAQAVHDVVMAYRARIRAGTASTLNKGSVSGSNLKPWRQKGLGRARAGYRQSPIWRGGGVVFGPKPRSYEKRVTKKIGSLALARILSEKISSGALKVLNDLSIPEGRTKEIMAVAKNLQAKRKTMFIVNRLEENIKRAARNAAEIEVSSANNVSVYQLMLYPNLFATKDAMGVLVERLRKARGG